MRLLAMAFLLTRPISSGEERGGDGLLGGVTGGWASPDEARLSGDEVGAE